jgi:hypothetical protein
MSFSKELQSPLEFAFSSSRAVKLLIALGANVNQKYEVSERLARDYTNHALDNAYAEFYVNQRPKAAKEYMASAKEFYKAGVPLTPDSAVIFGTPDLVASLLEREHAIQEFTLLRVMSRVINFNLEYFGIDTKPESIAAIVLKHCVVNQGKLTYPHNRDPGSNIYNALRRNNQTINVARMFLKAGADPNFQDENKRTLLKGVIQDSKSGLLDKEQAKKAEALLREFGAQLQASSSKKAPKSEYKKGETTHGNKWLRSILEYVQPPEKPKNISDKGLEKTIKNLGTHFPDDFLEFMKIFGSGYFKSVGEFRLLNPFTTEMADELKSLSHWWIEDGLREDFDSDIQLYPDTKGFLPCININDTTAYFGWIVKGEPNTWKMAEFYDEVNYMKGEKILLPSKIKFTEYLHKKLTRAIPLRQNYGKAAENYDYKTDVTFVQASN